MRHSYAADQPRPHTFDSPSAARRLGLISVGLDYSAPPMMGQYTRDRLFDAGPLSYNLTRAERSDLDLSRAPVRAEREASTRILSAYSVAVESDIKASGPITAA